MVKKKVVFGYAVVVAAVFALVALCCAATNVRPASAEESTPEITVVDATSYPDAFDIESGTLNAFTVPSTVTGYFRVEVPTDVTRIKANAFRAANEGSKLADRFLAVDLPDTVTAVEKNAFAGNEMLVEVVLSETLASGISESGIAPSVNKVTDGNRTLKIAGDNIVAKDGAGNAGEWLLVKYLGNAERLTLPATAAVDASCTAYNVYARAFAGNETLVEATIPGCVKSIGESAFAGCSKLRALELGDGVKTLGAAAFYGAKLKTLDVPASVTEIGESAFGANTALASVEFAGGSDKIKLGRYAFTGCTALKTLELPQKATVLHQAFDGCSSLLWVYVGDECEFINNAGDEVSISFFPTDNGIAFIYGNAAAYDAMTKDAKQATFKSVHGAAATYAVDVAFYVGASETPAFTHKRLHGKSFDYVRDAETGGWSVVEGYATLPVQAAHYAKTVWYAERELTTAVDVAAVNTMLETRDAVALYCYQTINEPTLPSEPSSWVYNANISYDIADKSKVLKAMRCPDTYDAAQLAALDFAVVYTDKDSKPADTPAAISENGVYKVNITLDKKYGEWVKPVAATVTVNVNTGSFNVVLVVFLIIIGVAIVVTITTAVIRKRVQAKSRKKQISSQEAIEKFKAVGGETHLE